MQDKADLPILLNAPEALHPLMQLVLATPGLQARLATLLEPDRFKAAMRAIASEYALDFPDGALDDMFRPDPLGLSRWEAAPVTMAGWPGLAWLPGRSVPTGDAPAFDWTWFGDAKTADPFFEDAVRAANNFPFNRMFRTRTSLDTLIAGTATAATTPLSGFIFHMSRCGSTLLARILGAAPHHLVASEPEPLDGILMWAETSSASHQAKLDAIRSVVAALGRRRNPAWQRFFIKVDAWHMLSWRLLRDAFPDVPWVFLYRDPIEVMTSIEGMPGIQTVPGILPAAVVGIENPHEVPQRDYCAILLARICEAAIENMRHGGGMIVDYADIVSAALDGIPRHLGFVPDASERTVMENASRGYSKNPSDSFVPDSDRKQAMASAEVREAVDRYLPDLRVQLRSLSFKLPGQ